MSSFHPFPVGSYTPRITDGRADSRKFYPRPDTTAHAFHDPHQRAFDSYRAAAQHQIEAYKAAGLHDEAKQLIASLAASKPAVPKVPYKSRRPIPKKQEMISSGNPILDTFRLSRQAALERIRDKQTDPAERTRRQHDLNQFDGALREIHPTWLSELQTQQENIFRQAKSQPRENAFNQSTQLSLSEILSPHTLLSRRVW